MKSSKIFTKRNLLTLGIILAAVLLVVLILVLTGGRGKKAERFTAGEDSAYPYAWTQEKDGSVHVVPCAAVPEGYGWLLTGSDAAVAAVTEQRGENGLTYLLTPTGAGDCFFELSLAAGEDSEDVLCRLLMTVEVSGGKKLKAAVTGNRLSPVEGILRGGTEWGAAYRLWTGEDGTLQLRLRDSERADDWKLTVRTPVSLGDSGLRNEDGAVSVRLYARKAGEISFVLYSPSRLLSLTVSGPADRELNLLAAAHEMRQHPDWAGQASGYADADVVTGPVPLPEGAEDVTYAQGVLGQGIGVVSTAEFSYLGCQWKLYVSPGGGFSEKLEEKLDRERIETLFIPAGLLQALLEAGRVTAWCDTQTRGYLLEGEGEGIGRDALLQTAAAVMTEES